MCIFIKVQIGIHTSICLLLRAQCYWGGYWNPQPRLLGWLSEKQWDSWSEAQKLPKISILSDLVGSYIFSKVWSPRDKPALWWVSSQIEIHKAPQSLLGKMVPRYPFDTYVLPASQCQPSLMPLESYLCQLHENLLCFIHVWCWGQLAQGWPE